MNALAIFDFGAFQILWHILCGELVEVCPDSGNRFDLQVSEEGFGALVEVCDGEEDGEVKWCNDVLRLSAHEGERSPGVHDIYIWDKVDDTGVWVGDLQGELVPKVFTSRGPTASSSFKGELYRMKARSQAIHTLNISGESPGKPASRDDRHLWRASVPYDCVLNIRLCEWLVSRRFPSWTPTCRPPGSSGASLGS